MVDKIDFSNFDIEGNLTDCSTDENLSDLTLSDSSSENGDFEDCSNETMTKSFNGAKEVDVDKLLSDNFDEKKQESEKKIHEILEPYENDHDISSDQTINLQKLISDHDFEDDIFKLPDDDEQKLEKPINQHQNYNLCRNDNKIDQINLDEICDEMQDKNLNEFPCISNSLSGKSDLSYPQNNADALSQVNEFNELQYTNSESCETLKIKFDQASVEESELDSEISITNFESLECLNSKYKKYIDASKTIDLDFDGINKHPTPYTPQNSARSSKSPTAKNFGDENIMSDEKRFQNLQEEINLLNILMYEAENKTEKCGSLYNSFTNEINNNFANRVVDDCTGSLASLVDGASSKFDALSVKSELLFSDYGKSESNFDISESPDPNISKNAINLFYDEETKSNVSTNEKVIEGSHKSTSESTVCFSCKSENSIIEKNNRKVEICKNDLSVEDRIVILWNQIIRLKCALKNLQLNLKEQQMDTLMQINEFLINQNMNTNNLFNNEIQSSASCILFDRGNESKNDEENLSNTSLMYSENNKIREDLALNNLKIALIECNLLSSTASSLINCIPKYENSSNLSSKSDTSNSISCCCERIKSEAVCLCSRKINFKSDRSVKLVETPRIKQSFSAKLHNNIEEIKTDRKAKSHEEIGSKFNDAKYCLSESAVFEDISPRACI